MFGATAAGAMRCAPLTRPGPHPAPALAQVYQRTPLEWCQPEYRDPESPAHDEAHAILQPVTGRGQPVSPGAGQEPSGIQVRIEASGLPDRSWRPDSGSRPRNLHIGVQHREDHGELLGPCPADAGTAA